MATLNSPSDEGFLYAVQLTMGSVVSMTLQAANDLGIFGVMAAEEGAKLSASEIVSKLDSSSIMNPDAPVMVDRMLRLMCSHSIVDCNLEDDRGSGRKQRKYGLNSVSKWFVKNEDGVSLAPFMSLVQDKHIMSSWPELKNAVLEGGIPFNRVHGTSSFEYTGLDQKFNQVFNAAMYNHTTMVMKQVLHSYKGFEQLNLLVDVGGGLGHTIKAITTKYPHIKGINFDLPHVVEHAPIVPGVEHVGGDMFQSVPQGDAILITFILHDWSDAHCLALLKNCYKAIPDVGKVIVMDMVAPIVPDATPSSKVTAQADVLMMATNTGGNERSRDEFMALATGAGFKGIRFELLVCNYWIMEFYK